MINSFRKINSIGFKTHDVEGFAKTFADLQDHLYALGMDTNPSRTEAPVSYLEIGEPMPGLSPSTYRSLERQALNLALQDAKEKFQSTLSLAGIDKYKIVNYYESAPGPQFGRDESRKVSAPASGEAPVEFASLLVSKHLHVRFEYTGGDLNVPF